MVYCLSHYPPPSALQSQGVSRKGVEGEGISPLPAAVCFLILRVSESGVKGIGIAFIAPLLYPLVFTIWGRRLQEDLLFFTPLAAVRSLMLGIYNLEESRESLHYCPWNIFRQDMILHEVMNLQIVP